MPFDLMHELWRDCFFGLSYRTPDSQTGVHVDGGSSPKRPSCFFF